MNTIALNGRLACMMSDQEFRMVTLALSEKAIEQPEYESLALDFQSHVAKVLNRPITSEEATRMVNSFKDAVQMSANGDQCVVHNPRLTTLDPEGKWFTASAVLINRGRQDKEIPVAITVKMSNRDSEGKPQASSVKIDFV